MGEVMIGSILMFIPEEAYLPMLAIAGILMIVGLRRLAMGLGAAIVALALIGPFVDSLIANLPPWLLALLMLGLVLFLFRVIFGRRVVDVLFSLLLRDLLLAPFRFMRSILHTFGPGPRA